MIGVYDVPAVWTRSDDPEQARRLVAAAERTLRLLPPDSDDAARARLLATIAVESRGTVPGGRPLRAARRAEEIARRLDDASLLAFALNGVFMQTFHRTGLAARRDAIGAELVALSARNGLPRYEVLGHLVRIQARCALADLAGADRHAAAADALAARHDLPLVAVFTTWYRALRTSLTAPPDAALTAYDRAADLLPGSGMPGLSHGLPPLARLSVALRHDRPVPAGADTDWGPYEPWVRPLLLAGGGRRDAARAALRAVPDPPRDLMCEVLWCLVARAAVAVDDREAMRRARTALLPAAGEEAAGSGLLTTGPVSAHLDRLTAALERAGGGRTG